MAKKNRNAPRPPLAATTSGAAAPAADLAAPTLAAAPQAGRKPETALLPTEIARGDWTVPLLAAMAFLAPAIGAPVQELMQDTLKSLVVVFASLLAAAALFWQQRERRSPLRWHAMLYFPVLLGVYAIGSTLWSHTYLAGVEAVRWFFFGLIVWLGINTCSRERTALLAWGIHLGAIGAGLWAALQFWLDIKLFLQGPNPGSSFVNRNFFAEYISCTIPFGLLLLARARRSSQIALLAATNGFVIVCLMMTGTRGALVAMWLNLLLLLPLAGWLYRRQLGLASWTVGQRLLAAGVLLATVAGLGLIPTGNAEIAKEQRGNTALERAVRRTASIDAGDESLGYRFLFVRETASLIQANPLTGVGAGAWEVDIARYQNPQVGIDNHGYAHNEFVQLVAEYGMVGWLALLLLMAYLLRAAWRTVADPSADALQEAPLRVAALCALLALFVTSAVGFPWHLTSTFMVFALALVVLGASDARLYRPSRLGASSLPWSPAASQALAVATLGCLALAVYGAAQAAKAERKLVTAARIGTLILQTGDVQDPKWNEFKALMLSNLKDGVAAAPHNRRLIEPPTEQLVRLGDWKNAAWAWDALVASRPYSVALLSGAARAHMMAGDVDKAKTTIARIRAVRPDSLAWMPLEVLLATRTAQDGRAVEVGLEAVKQGLSDHRMLTTAFEAAWRTGNYPAAQTLMDKRMETTASTRRAGLILLGNMYTTAAKQPDKALQHFKAALDMTAAGEREALRPQIPAQYWQALGYPAQNPSSAATNAGKSSK